MRGDPHPFAHALAKHGLAFLIVLGLLAAVNMAMLGLVKIDQPPIALLVGQVIGSLFTLAMVVATEYFPRGKVVTEKQTGESHGP